jgi:hypothetical protein
MSKKGILYIVILFVCLCACDMKYPLKVNEQKQYMLTCNENCIEFKVTGLMGTRCQVYLKAKKGKFVCETDRFCLIKYPQYKMVNKQFMQFKYNNKDVVGTQFIEEGKTLICYFSFGEYAYNSPVVEYILIPPSNFIMCAGQPLITDTIRISLK